MRRGEKIDKKEKKIGVAALKIMLRQAGLSVSGLHGSLIRRAVECGLLPKLATGNVLVKIVGCAVKYSS